jgi:hypothetical protein
MATQTAVSESGEEEEAFAVVLSRLDKEQLPIVAAAIFQRIQPTHYDAASSKVPSVGEPIYGSYHAPFPYHFRHGHALARQNTRERRRGQMGRPIRRGAGLGG